MKNPIFESASAAIAPRKKPFQRAPRKAATRMVLLTLFPMTIAWASCLALTPLRRLEIFLWTCCSVPWPI